MASALEKIHPWLSTIEPRLHRIAVPRIITIQELRAYFDALGGVCRALEASQTWVVDIRKLQATTFDAKKRSMYAAFEREMAPYDERFCAGVAFVTRNALQRGVLTATYWIAPPVYPHGVFSSEDEGVAWARAKLAESLSDDA